jgi:DNA-binding transcriptional LysR family regulator
MELRELLSFRAVVQEGSFTAAAKALHLTQPAVSLHVKSLEEEVGARLMERDGRGVRLTAAGKVMLEAADQALAGLEEATRRIREMEAPGRGTLLLACGDTVALGLLPPVLAAFREAQPLADVVIQNHGSRKILDLVLRREVDLGIVTRPPWLDPALWSRVLLEEPFWLALPRGHGLATQTGWDLTALHCQPAVFLAKPSETRALTDRGFRQAGAEPTVVMESGNLEVVKTYVAAGMGFTVLPEMAVAEADRARLEVRPLPPEFPRRRLALVRRKDRAPGFLAAEMLRLLAERFRRVAEPSGT